MLWIQNKCVEEHVPIDRILDIPVMGLKYLEEWVSALAPALYLLLWGCRTTEAECYFDKSWGGKRKEPHTLAADVRSRLVKLTNCDMAAFWVEV